MTSRIRAVPAALALLAALAVLAAPAPPAARARLYEYRNEKGEVLYTNDPSIIPEDRRGTLTEFRLEKALPSEDVSAASPDAAGDAGIPAGATDAGYEPALFSRAVAMGAQVVSEAMVPLKGKPASWVIEEGTGLIALPETLAGAEAAARPYLRMLLLFLMAVVGGTVAGVFIRRFRREGVVEGLASFPLFQVKGALFGASVFAGGFLAWLAWHGAQLDWQSELAKLWQATGGAVAARTGDAPGRLEIELSGGTKATVESPVQLVQQHDALAALLLAALARAEKDVAFLESVCSRREGADNPGETVKRLLKMREILDEARRKEDDLQRFRRAAAQRGFSLGADPIAQNQDKFRDLQTRLQKAQADCMALSVKGHKVRDEALEGVR